MRLLLTLFAFILAPALHGSSSASPSLDTFIDRELAASGAPGVAYATVDHGKVHSAARGTIRAGSGQAVTPDTPFLTGSISKSFTALAIMQLAEAGKLNLDDGIGTYLPAFGEHPSGAITIRQLLSHTSGYSTVQGNGVPEKKSQRSSDLADYAAQVAEWKTACPPGECWQYSNANYRILGALIEAMSGQEYAEYVQAHILTPIGMKNSFVSDGRMPRHAAIAHRPWFGSKRAYEPARTKRVNGPAGGIFASAGDLALYLAVMLDGKDDIISAAGKAQMLRPASKVSPVYGLGWFLDTRAGTAYHDGLVPGIETLATIIPSERKGAVVLVNANSGIGFGDTLQLRRGIIAKALGLKYSGRGPGIWPKMTYLLVITLPVFYLACIVWAWSHRDRLRAKSGAAGMFSLWFPLLAMFALAWVLLIIVPAMFGVSIRLLLLFQPDFTGAMIAAAVMAPVWAMFRFALACSAAGQLKGLMRSGT